MILVDTNLLIYAHISSFKQHETARDWLDRRLNGSAKVGLPWPALLGFVRITSNPRVFEKPLTVLKAWEQVEGWLDVPTVWIPSPTDAHHEILGKLIRENQLTARQVPDAHLAALSIEHGLELCSTDGDFARFSGLRWRNPVLNR